MYWPGKKVTREKQNYFDAASIIKPAAPRVQFLFQNTDSIRDYDISLDGTSICFMADQDRCIRCLDVPSGTVKCATSGPGSEISLSRDGKYLAFVRYEKTGVTSRGKFIADVFTSNLYFLKIKHQQK